MIHHRIEVLDAHAHRFAVTLRIDQPQARQVLSLPTWIPGSYLVREFTRNLSPLLAWQGKRQVEVKQLDKATWEIETSGSVTGEMPAGARTTKKGSGPLTVEYEVYAFDTSVRAAFLDASRGFFNGTSVFLKAHGFDAEPQAVKITGLPKNWQVATALPAVKVNAQGVGDYLAPDYDALVDHPVELGTFWRGEFTVRGVRHEFVVAGATADFDGQKLLHDTRRICEAQINFWHGKRKAAFDHYVFMLNVVEDGYGGLEHRQSTALICARKDLPRTGRTVNKDAYTTLLGLISHEYFHTWNVKRLKPVEFAPYDYTRETHTRMLWFFEGFTSYYDDQFLLRTGLIDAATYLKLVGKTINQVLATPGRLSYSVAQASFDAWTRYYRPDENTANATVSYYTKGSLVALALDLALRELPASHKPQASLDGVMQRLWQLGRPITQADVAQALADEAGQLPQALPVKAGTSVLAAWQTVLDTWTEQCDELPLPGLLDKLGIAWTSKSAPLPQQWGLRIQDSGPLPKVQAIMRGSLAERIGLSVGDELLALDGWRIKKAEDLAAWHDAQRAQPLLVSRDQKVLTLNIPAQAALASTKAPARSKAAPVAAPVAPALSLIGLGLADVSTTPDRLARRQAWLRT